jgi:hypothetical protein
MATINELEQPKGDQLATDTSSPPAEISPLVATLAPEAGPSPSWRRFPVFDTMLAGLAIVFAFLTACFPVANSDFFMHLASGRLLAMGDYRFGVDPFSFTSEGVYWANHSWLYDLFLYGMYSVPRFGGELIVLCKGVLLATLAGAMILAGRKKGQSLGLPCAFAVLGVLVLSPRLLLQPIVISYLFLGLTWWLLQLTEDHPGESSPAKQTRCCAALLILFALWANIDACFLLGPITAGLYCLGEYLQGFQASGSARRWLPSRYVRMLLVVAVLGLAVCLLNPHHVRVFELPWQTGLSPAAGALARDYELRMLFASPLDAVYFKTPLGRNVAGFAYFPLIALGLLSFALTYDRLRLSRVLVWLMFFLLSLTNYRAIPFFAVVAAPISAVNFLDFAAARLVVAGRESGAWRFPLVAGRAAVLLGSLLLVAATIPGWLQGSPERRRVGLSVRIDPSLHQAAVQMKKWREEGTIGPEERIFNTSPDVACYLAWFCREVRGYLDMRLPLFTAAANDYVTVRGSLIGTPVEEDLTGAGRPDPAWRSVFPKWNIRYLVAHLQNPRHGPSLVIADRLLRNPDGIPNEWTVCYLDGQTMIARWNVPGTGGAPELNAEHLAYGPSAATAPSHVPDALPPRQWWSFVRKQPSRPLKADEAFLHFYRYQVMRGAWAARKQQVWEAAMAASIFGSAATYGAPLANSTLLQMRIDLSYRFLHGQSIPTPAGNMEQLAEQLLNAHMSSQRDGPVASLYLALRAGRRALAEQPGDADTYYLLAQVYFHLAWRTGEQGNDQSLPHLTLLRQAQAMAAVQKALQCNPDHERAHGLLAELAQRLMILPPGGPQAPGNLLPRPNLELELVHRREVLRCARKRMPATQLVPMEKQVKSLKATVGTLRDQFELAAQGRPRRLRAELALDRGLGDTALKTLLEAPEGEADPTGRLRELRPSREARIVELLLASGQVEEALVRNHPADRQALGILPAPLNLPAAVWFHVQSTAALGDYEEADQVLASRSAAPGDHFSSPSGLLASTLAHQLLWEAPLAAGMPWQIQRKTPWLFGLPADRRAMLAWAIQQSGSLLERETDLAAVRGCLALEAGATDQALGHFRRVLERCQHRRSADRKAAVPVFVLRGLALAVRHRDLLEANGFAVLPSGADD